MLAQKSINQGSTATRSPPSPPTILQLVPKSTPTKLHRQVESYENQSDKEQNVKHLIGPPLGVLLAVITITLFLLLAQKLGI